MRPRLLPLLAEAGYEVVGTTRDPTKADLLRRLGAPSPGTLARYRTDEPLARGADLEDLVRTSSAAS